MKCTDDNEVNKPPSGKRRSNRDSVKHDRKDRLSAAGKHDEEDG